MTLNKSPNFGAIGTKLGTFIVNDELEIKNIHVSQFKYNEYLINSINTGIGWLLKVLQEKKIDDKGISTIKKLHNLVIEGNFNERLNHSIIETCYNIDDKLTTIVNKNSYPNFSHNNRKNHHLGPHNLSQITEHDIEFNRGLMVETLPGKYTLYFYVKHQDHLDLVPYEYIIDKIKDIPNLLYNGHKIN